MNMTRTWTFGQKLGAGFALMVMLTVAMTAVAFFALRTVVDSNDRVVQHTGSNLVDAEILRTSMHKEVANVRGFLLSQDPRYVELIQAANAEFAGALGRIRERGLTREGERLIAEISADAAEQQKVIVEFIQQRGVQEGVAGIGHTLEQRLIPKLDALAKSVHAMIVANEIERDKGRTHASSTARGAISMLLAFAIGALVLAIAIALLLTRSLSSLIGGSVQHIRSSSAELQAAATEQATGARQQASAMAEIGMTLGELLASSRQIAESGQHVAKMAADSNTSARAGEQAVGSAQEAVGSIKQQVDMIVAHMLDLGKKSQRAGGILEIINETAEQTNILAINATIEAAGAGEAGRRFAVVGEEIRKLADRVGGSTKEIRTLIDEIRAAVNATVMATETGSKTVEAGTQRFAELQSAFARIGDLVTSTMEAGKEIELSTKQQSSAVEQVNAAIANVSQATKETESSSKEVLQTASQLSLLSDNLGQLVQSR